MNQTPKESFLNNILASHKNAIAYAITLILQRRSSLTGVCTNHNMTETVKGPDHPMGSVDHQGRSGALLLWGPISITLAPHGRLIHHRGPPGQAEHTLSNAKLFLMKTPTLLRHGDSPAPAASACSAYSGQLTRAQGHWPSVLFPQATVSTEPPQSGTALDYLRILPAFVVYQLSIDWVLAT